MKTEHKLFAGLALLVALGIGFYFSYSGEKAEKEQRATSSSKTDLPNATLKPEEVEKIAKIELKNADKPGVVLEKKGADWMITAPIQAKANQSDVKTLIDGLKELKLTEAIDRGTATYDQYEVSDAKGAHMTLSDGSGGKLLDVVFGKKGGRGQMLRVAGTDGVYVDPDYQPFLITKDVKGWRDKTILKIDDKNVTAVEIENANGKYAFHRDGDNWAGSFVKSDKKPAKAEDKDADKAPGDKKDAAPKKDDKKADAPKKDDAKKVEIKDGFAGFDGKKVEDMLRALKSLSAIDFADDGADTGLAAAVDEGGIIRITMKDGTVHVLSFGKKQKGSNRFLTHEGDDTVYVVSSWSADWASAEPSKFEKKDDGKPGMKDPHGGGDDDAPPDMDLDMPGGE